MPHHLPRFGAKTKPALCVALLIVSAGLVVSARAWLRPAPAISPPPAASPQKADGERLEAEIITLHPTGFDPAGIERPRGRFLLGLDNRSGLDDIELQFTREGGGRMQVLGARRKRSSWREVVNLPPGRYLLTEASHPDWECAITITDR
jgi:hypothetical protein